MNLVIVGIGDCCVSAEVSDVLVTYALGSCVCVTIYDEAAKIGGLLHLLLPDSRLDPEKARGNPYLFADTGIPMLFHEAYALGARKERITAHIAGGSQMSAMGGFLDVGLKNIQAARQTLGRNGIQLRSEAVGGNFARTVHLHVASGEMLLYQANADCRRFLQPLAAVAPAKKKNNLNVDCAGDDHERMPL